MVSDSIAASTAMSDGDTDPEAVSYSAKLDQLLGLVTTMNTRLDCQSQRLTSVEAALPLLTLACALLYHQDLLAGDQVWAQDHAHQQTLTKHRQMSMKFMIKATARTAARWNQNAPVTTRAQVTVVVSRHKAATVAGDRAVALAMVVLDMIAAMA
jgi:hypothetical protein